MGPETEIDEIRLHPAEFAAIQELFGRCEAKRKGPNDPWPEEEWRAGLDEIIGFRSFYHEILREIVVKVADSNNEQ